MKKIIFLLPPSEGKNSQGNSHIETLQTNFKKPRSIAIEATEKDLKCSGKRYEEGINLNKKCVQKRSENYTEAINRYSGVMYNAIEYQKMFESGKCFFDANVLILSGMYGILNPRDIIGNYKLPIETKGLIAFWGDQITKYLQELKGDYVVNLLPLSYQKMINFNKLDSQIIHVNFYTQKEGQLKKMTHGVKKVKGEWLREVCERGENNFNNFGGIVIDNGADIEIQIIK